MDGYKAAFDTFIRKGEEVMGVEERKALSVGADPDGGYVVNPDLSGRIVMKVFESSPMRAYASVQVISSDALEGLFDLNEASSGWVGETDSRSETNTPQLGKWRIPAHELYAKPKATQKLLDDASINMEAWLASKVAEKFSRDEANAFVVGNGTNKPRGFLTYGSGTTLPGTIEQFPSGVNGALAATPDGGDVLINALYGLKQQYRANATWFMNRASTRLVRKAKDSNGSYIWVPGIAAGQPASLLGYPVAAFEDMPDPATNSLSIAVGDMRESYQIVDRLGIRTLRDPYSAKPYVEFYTTKRVGGDVVNFEAIKLVKLGS
jgi:HK97 family phage major capsid protein